MVHANQELPALASDMVVEGHFGELLCTAKKQVTGRLGEVAGRNAGADAAACIDGIAVGVSQLLSQHLII